jgi:hypothetical protein
MAGQINAWLRRANSTWVLLGATLTVAGGILVWRLLQRGTFAPFDLASLLDLGLVALLGLVTVTVFWLVGKLGKIATWPHLSLPA